MDIDAQLINKFNAILIENFYYLSSVYIDTKETKDSNFLNVEINLSKIYFYNMAIVDSSLKSSKAKETNKNFVNVLFDLLEQNIWTNSTYKPCFDKQDIFNLGNEFITVKILIRLCFYQNSQSFLSFKQKLVNFIKVFFF